MDVQEYSDQAEGDECQVGSSMPELTYDAMLASYNRAYGSSYLQPSHELMQPPRTLPTWYAPSPANWQYSTASSYSERPELLPTPPDSSSEGNFPYHSAQVRGYNFGARQLQVPANAERIRQLPLPSSFMAQPTQYRTIMPARSSSKDKEYPTCGRTKGSPSDEASLFVPSDSEPDDTSSSRKTRSSTALTRSQRQKRQSLPTASDHTSEGTQEESTPRIQPASHKRKRGPQNDPENVLIKRLRTVDRLSWPEILRLLNEQRVADGRAPTFTEAAVYGRFKRNAPRIAAAEGDTTFKVSDWLYLQTKDGSGGVPGSMEMRAGRAGGSHTSDIAVGDGHSGDSADMTFAAAAMGVGSHVPHLAYGGYGSTTDLDAAMAQFTSEDDEALLQDYHEISQHLWDIVARRFAERSGKVFGSATCAARVRMLTSAEHCGQVTRESGDAQHLHRRYA